MNKYVIVTDSTVDLPLEVINQYDIRVIPMSFTMGDKVYYHYPDEREMALEDFYHQLKEGAMPSTSQVNPADCADFLREILKEGLDIIYIVFTTGLSGTYQSACIAKEELEEEFPERKIICIDSLCASAGEGYLVYQAAKRKEEGMDIDTLSDWVVSHRHNVRHWFTVEDLFHLKRGGRLSSVEAIVGSTLKIKPIISVDEEGKLVVRAKVRGTKKSAEFLLDKIREEGTNPSEQTVFVAHADNPEQAEALKNQILENGLAKDVIITKIGPIIGTHVGSGMFATIFMGEEK